MKKNSLGLVRKIGDLFNKLSILSDNVLESQEKATQDTDYLFARFTTENLLIKNDHTFFFDELKNIINIVQKQNSKTKNIQEGVTHFLVGLQKEADSLRENIENGLPQIMDSKITAAL